MTLVTMINGEDLYICMSKVFHDREVAEAYFFKLIEDEFKIELTDVDKKEALAMGCFADITHWCIVIEDVELCTEI